ncbi:MAG: coniferyl aldehyde dehydrogenase, partial [Usitatibacter sp.]
MNLKDGSANSSALADAFQRQKAARDHALAPDRPTRDATLAALEALVAGNVDAFATAIDLDFRARSKAETMMLEVFPSLEGIRHARRHLGAWMRPRRAPTNFWFLPGSSRILPQPLGVVGIVVPWNYPLYLAIGPLVAALAAGNRAMVKMSESVPSTGALLARLVSERFDPAVLTVINGGVDVARDFVALPFDHLLFTGSTDVGRQVMRAASANLTPVTLELGGKSPAIVGRGIDVAEAADRIAYGKCLNAGQTCIAPDYALVPRESVDAFCAAGSSAIARLYPSLRDNPDYTAIIDDRHHARLAGYLDEARQGGARVIEVNPAGEDFTGSPKMAPALVVGAPETTRLMCEEVFGPILSVVPYDTLDDAIAYVNARPRPLALYIFDHNRAAVDQVLARTLSGGVSVNETLLHIAQEELPFGGVGPSGMGEYHGRAGFDTFSKRKPVFHQSRINGLKLFRPPYGKRFATLVKLLLR